jgi:hypothetical protein
MSEGRHLWAGLHLLDRQLVAHDRRLAGCVDDLQLRASDDGDQLYIAAILSGPGALAYRLGRRRFGRWLQQAHARAGTSADDDPTSIPFNVVADIGADIKLGLDAEETGTASAERWTRDHIITRIPGSGHAAQ